MALKNYTLGRGKVYFSLFKPGTLTPEGFRYIGNTPEFNLTIESEDLEHFGSDQGVREKDDSVPLTVTRSGSLTCDDIQPENVALFFYGVSSLVTQTAQTGVTETFTDIKKGHSYALGVTAANPSGYAGVSVTSVMVGAVAMVLATDYTVDADNGMIHFVEGSTKAIDGADVTVAYNVLARTIERVTSGSSPVEGAIRYVANNPKGKNFNYVLPYVKITPNGDLAIKGDEWQVIPFSLEALKPADSEAIYMNGRPFGV